VCRDSKCFPGLNPIYAVQYFTENGWCGFLALGVLVVTGREVFHSDIGYFGRKPIDLAWLPSLALNRFGQCALLLESSEASHNPFYLLAAKGATMPLVLFLTMAAIIHSPALIFGTDSFAR